MIEEEKTKFLKTYEQLQMLERKITNKSSCFVQRMDINENRRFAIPLKIEFVEENEKIF